MLRCLDGVVMEMEELTLFIKRRNENLKKKKLIENLKFHEMRVIG